MVNPEFDTADDIPDEPEIDPDISIMEVRGEKELGFMGMKHVEMSEEEKDRIHEVYSDILIDFDDVKDEYEGVDRAWHIGRLMDEHDVYDRDEITLTDLGAFNTMDDMYARRLFFARFIYEFWPNQRYDRQHSIRVLGELASRATNQGREDEAYEGYQQLVMADEDLAVKDVFAWSKVEDHSLDDIVAKVADQYDSKSKVARGVKRVLYLCDENPGHYSRDRLRDLIQKETTDE